MLCSIEERERVVLGSFEREREKCYAPLRERKRDMLGSFERGRKREIEARLL